ncbi:MAG: hypothetical protein HN866_04945 [Gammaproteobacteria bacterium]|jgi:hypothetical protein|nr:hypothetical protein [Gammaproteobacteria bacterium]
MSKRRKSLNKTKQILEDIKKRTPKIVFTAKNLIVTLRNRSQLDKWLKIYPDGEYIIK